jgi:hypothetical protein
VFLPVHGRQGVVGSACSGPTKGNVPPENPFRNTEIVTVGDGKIAEVEVYFGWSLPYEAPAGGFVDL